MTAIHLVVPSVPYVILFALLFFRFCTDDSGLSVILLNHYLLTYLLLNTKLCSICRRLAGIPLSNYSLPSTPVCGVTVNPEGQKWYQSKCRPHIPIFLCDFNTHYMLIFHRLATIHNGADIRLAHRQRIGIDRLCDSIGVRIMILRAISSSK